jgi:hypothetical protein
MARSLETIQQEIKTEVRVYPELNKFLFPEDGGSNVSVFNLSIFIVSLAIFTFEVLIDGFMDDVVSASQEAPVGNPQWIRKQMFLFQNGDTLELDDDFLPFYPVVDESLQIIKFCSIQESFSSEIKIKVAKLDGTDPAPLTGPELTAVENYYFGSNDEQGIGFAGVRAEFITQEPDRMEVTGNVSFNGQFIEANVKQAVIDAIDLHLASIGFDGVVYLNRLVTDVEAVDGVVNFQISSVRARSFDVLLASATIVPVNGSYDTVAGYLISEDTAGATLSNTITMVQA